MPKITVIVPVYNVEPYLRRCVDSILAQTFTDFELILVDDGSPDNCGAICDEYAARDERVRVIHQPNGGLSAARNAGIDWAFANSDSEWLSFIDSDDWVHPKYLEALHHGAMETGLPIIIGGFERTTGGSPTVSEEDIKAEVWDTDKFYYENNVTATIACGTLYLKNIFGNHRYPVGKINEDEYLTYQILFQTPKLAAIKAPLYAYYQNPDGIMGSPWTPKRLDVIDALKGQINFFHEHGYDELYRKHIKTLAANLSMQVALVQKCDSEMKKEYIPILRKEFSELRREHKELRPIRGNEYIYERFYPHLMGLYWRAKGIKDKFSKGK